MRLEGEWISSEVGVLLPKLSRPQISSTSPLPNVSCHTVVNNVVANESRRAAEKESQDERGSDRGSHEVRYRTIFSKRRAWIERQTRKYGTSKPGSGKRGLDGSQRVKPGDSE
jgi:hypothetical protein